jgi:hypothetical protein
VVTETTIKTSILGKAEFVTTRKTPILGKTELFMKPLKRYILGTAYTITKKPLERFLGAAILIINTMAKKN